MKSRWGGATIQPLPGLDLREAEQLKLLDELAAYYAELPFPDKRQAGTRYWYQNTYFSYADAIVLYGMLRHFRPKRVIEVGAGFSSAVMLDTNELFLGRATHFSFIEPYPDRLFELFNEQDRQGHEVLVQPIQRIEADHFLALGAGDILFIDSSHVAKVGSDVNRLIFEILPRLKTGVLVHFHDILWPFDYPGSWFREGRAWNEAYLVRAFLQYNPSFPILYWNSFMGRFHPAELEAKMPLCLRDTGGSIWLRHAGRPA